MRSTEPRQKSANFSVERMAAGGVFRQFGRAGSARIAHLRVRRIHCEHLTFYQTSGAGHLCAL